MFKKNMFNDPSSGKQQHENLTDVKGIENGDILEHKGNCDERHGLSLGTTAHHEMHCTLPPVLEASLSGWLFLFSNREIPGSGLEGDR